MTPMNKWVSMYGNAVSIAERRPEGYARNITLRYPIYAPFDGSALRITLDNFCGSEPVTITKVTVAPARFSVDGKVPLTCPADTSTLAEVTFGEEMSPSVTMAAHGTAISNPVDLKVEAGSTLCVNIYLREFTLMQSAVFVCGPLSKGYYSMGDQTEQEELPMDQTKVIHTFYFLSNIDILTSEENHSIICYGDSITAQSWPDYLSLRLKEQGMKDTSVIRRAASGTRILREYDCITYDWYGLKGTNRFHHEIPTAGGDILIIQQGINDIIHPVGVEVNEFRPMSDLPTVQELIDGLRWYLEEARKMNLTVYLGTLLPIGGWRTYAPFREDMRQQLNQWMRETKEADGCIDFDGAVLNPERPDYFLPEYDSGDHLHPSEKGYKAMAEAIELKWLKNKSPE